MVDVTRLPSAAGCLRQLDLIERVPLERYLEGVVPHEIEQPAVGPPGPDRACPYPARQQPSFQIDGYHLCNDTQCQVYSDPRQAGSAVLQAIAATRGRLLSWQVPDQRCLYASNGV